MRLSAVGARWLASVALCGALLLAGCGAAQRVEASVTPGTSGPVRVSADQPTYAVGQVIGVTVHNGLETPIYAFDTRSGCGILDLQVERQGQWATANAARCAMGRPARLVRIASGQDYTGSIAANQFGQPTSGLAAGTYRLALTYQLTSEVGAPMQPTTVYSSTFSIVEASGY